MTWNYPHFTEAEMRCKCGCGLLRFHPGYMDELVRLRKALGLAMTVTSACRCKAHNKAVGGHPSSLHVGDFPNHPGQQGTLATDIAAPDGAYRGRLFSLAWSLGWSIGWNAKKGFLHLDRRDFVGLPQTSFDY